MNTQSVSQLLKNIKNLLEGSFSLIEVKGEISSFSRSSTGHIYFNLSDSNSSISCAFFRNDYNNCTRLDPLIKNLKKGDTVICSGPIGVYAQRGTFQLIIKSLLIEGEGDLKKKFEILKANLSREGLFDLEIKKTIPSFPRKIAIITALHGAALKDFINIYQRRSPWCDLLILPCLVQGNIAGEKIRNALQKAIKFHLQKSQLDVIVLTRGGGSDEDLWCFNDEALAWEIYNCPVPVISAVGHQRDFTISDFVADLRCETPSAAAEKLSEVPFTINNNLLTSKTRLESLIKQNILSQKEKLLQCRPDQLFYKLSNNYKRLNGRLNDCSQLKSPEQLIHLTEKKLRLEDQFTQLNHLFTKNIEQTKIKLDSSQNLLEALNPNSVLNRGYSLTIDSKGQIIKSKKDFENLEKSTNLKLKFYDGDGDVYKK